MRGELWLTVCAVRYLPEFRKFKVDMGGDFFTVCFMLWVCSSAELVAA